MSNFKQKKWLCTAAMMGMMMLTSPVISVCAEEAIVVEDSNVDATDAETWSSKTGWVYKVIDGHLYKRLYNYSTGRWESDWILIE